MANLDIMRKRFQVSAVVLAAIAILGALYLMAPAGSSSEQTEKELLVAQNEFRGENVIVAPLRALPEKLIKAKADISQFYTDRLPARSSIISTEIGRLAKENDVDLESVKYSVSEAEIAGLQLVEVDAAVSGEYKQVAEFINAVERNKVFFLVDELTLADEKTSGRVKLDLKLESYLRPALGADLAPAKNDKKKDKKKAVEKDLRKPQAQAKK